MLRRFLIALAVLFPVAAHAALPCSAYPNTLTNGTLADANQVMANFNSILNCVNGLAPISVPTPGTVSNVKASLTAAGTTVAFTADNVIVGTALNGTLYTLTSYNQTLNTSTVGAGGMDVGTLPTSSFVGIYAIFNPTASTTSILATTCASSCPTIYGGANLPAGYTASALIGIWQTNGTPALVIGQVRNKTFSFGATSAFNVSTTHASITSVSISTIVPPPAIIVGGYFQYTCGTGTPGSGNVFTTLYGASVAMGTQSWELDCFANTGIGFQAPFSNLNLQTPQTIYYTNQVDAGTSPSAQALISSYSWP